MRETGAEPPMTRLLLVRHAKSSWDEPSLADRERPLSPKGRKAAARVAEHLQAEGLSVELVLCSSALRTRETLEALSPVFGDAEVQIEDRLYAASDDDLLARLREIPDRVGSAAMIGHNPGTHDLALHLVRSGKDLRRLRNKFPTGAVAVLEFRGPWSDLVPGSAKLASFVIPKDLA